MISPGDHEDFESAALSYRKPVLWVTAVALAVSLVRQFSFGQVVELKNAPIRILGKLTNPGSDHGFAMYFGMDEDIQIEEVSGAELDEQGGIIRIPIRILSD